MTTRGSIVSASVYVSDGKEGEVDVGTDADVVVAGMREVRSV